MCILAKAGIVQRRQRGEEIKGEEKRERRGPGGDAARWYVFSLC